MVIDSSANLSILLAEEDAETFARAIEGADQRLFSAASLVETATVIQCKKGDSGERELDLLLRGGFQIVAVGAEQAEIARAAYRRFGKGRHPQV
jgi:ribonuclease VapC